uniref:FAR1 domain-containing protein n=1 Tax=Davidia involucrata TaxID=16924 RepID=A0A5B7BU89_DAVIN
MDSDVGAGTVESSAGRDSVAFEGSAIQEPYVGMEFDSEDAAKGFYDKYARNVGFIMHIDQCCRSEVDKRILSQQFSCNKQGYYVEMKDQFEPIKKPRASMREACKAMMLVKVNESDKWVVTRFVKEHTHPLVISDCPSLNAMDHKDRRIQVLTMELERHDRLCDLYREQITTFLNKVEEQTELLSTKVQVVVNNVREFETEMQKSSYHR